jgi:uncharacterized protein (TIGR02646 family)
MRNLTKTATPAVLLANEQLWLDEIDAAVAAGEDPKPHQLRRYGHTEIKDALLLETNEKCGYCESKLRHITYGDVEHVVPKDSSPHLRFRWQNLTIACDVCNTKKSNKINVIDPYLDDPETAFFFTGPTIFAREGYDKASYTQTTLDLNRIQLVERRIKVIERILHLLRSAKRVSDPIIRQAMIDDIKENECDGSVEFSIMARTYIRALVVEGEL